MTATRQNAAPADSDTEALLGIPVSFSVGGRLTR